MNEKFLNLEVKVDSQSGTIRLSGYQKQIDQAKTIMHGILASMVMKSKSFDPIMLKFFKNREKYLADVILQNGK